ncbi:MAG: serine/threonine protein kinase [Planctomycetales bacterium]|nr:serine/threonine protein kinase [Planctomycetales bacterium]
MNGPGDGLFLDCPGCGAVLNARGRAPGQKVKCGKCGEVIAVPAEGGAAPAGGPPPTTVGAPPTTVPSSTPGPPVPTGPPTRLDAAFPSGPPTRIDAASPAGPPTRLDAGLSGPPTTVGPSTGLGTGGLGTGRAAPAAAPPPAQIVPGYVLHREVARGSAGTVYEATRKENGQRVAIKVLSDETASDAAALSAWRKVAETGQSILHDNLARVVDHRLEGPAGGDAGPLWVASEWDDGQPIGGASGRMRMSVDRVARLGIQVARALHAVHEKGLRHGAVQPGNISLGSGDHVVLLGLGVPRRPSREPTPYQAPEEAGGSSRPSDPRRMDVYALGAVLYEMLTAQLPLRSGAGGKSDSQAGLAKPRALDPRIPVAMESVVLKGLHPDPTRRYATALAMAEDLERFRKGQNVKAGGSLITSSLAWAQENRGQAALVGAGLAAVATGLVALALLPRGGPAGGATGGTTGTGGKGGSATGAASALSDLEDARANLGASRIDAARQAITSYLDKMGAAAVPEAHLIAAKTARLSGDLAAAHESLSHAEPAAGGSAAALAERGEILLGLGQAEAALAKFDAAVAADAKCAPAAAGRGAALLRLGRAEEAAAALAQATELDRDDTNAQVRLAEALASAGKVDEALKAAQAMAGKLVPPRGAAYVVGFCLEKKLRPDEALAQYQAENKTPGGDARAAAAAERLDAQVKRVRELGKALVEEIGRKTSDEPGRQELRAKAAEWLARCRETLDRTSDPATVGQIHYFAAQFERILGQRAEAEKSLTRVLSQPGGGRGQAPPLQARQMRADLRAEQDDLGGALEDYDWMANAYQRELSNPNRPPEVVPRYVQLVLRRLEIHRRLGDLRNLEGESDGLVRILGQLAAAQQEGNVPKPMRRQAWIYHGVTKALAGKVKEALADLERAREASEEDEQAGLHWLRAAIAMAKGNAAEARDWIQEELNLEKKDFERPARDLLSELDRRDAGGGGRK